MSNTSPQSPFAGRMVPAVSAWAFLERRFGGGAIISRALSNRVFTGAVTGGEGDRERFRAARSRSIPCNLVSTISIEVKCVFAQDLTWASFPFALFRLVQAASHVGQTLSCAHCSSVIDKVEGGARVDEGLVFALLLRLVLSVVTTRGTRESRAVVVVAEYAEVEKARDDEEADVAREYAKRERSNALTDGSPSEEELSTLRAGEEGIAP